MKTRVEISGQVARFVKRQAPEPRRALRVALRGLEKEQGDIKPLEGPLRDYLRLRAGGFRIIFAYAETRKGVRLIQCLFAERRNAVYEVFEQLLRRQLLAREKKINPAG